MLYYKGDQKGGNMSTVWLIDIDGTVCDDIPNETPELFATAKPIPGSLEKVKELYNNGDRVTFFTARTSAHAEATEKWLNDHGFPFESVCYNKPRISDGEIYHWVDNRGVLATFVPEGLK
jgi:uncharacterized HAD superfamily protein